MPACSASSSRSASSAFSLLSAANRCLIEKVPGWFPYRKQRGIELDLYRKNYSKLLQLLPGLHEMIKPVALVAPGYSDVHVHLIERHKHRLVLRMSQYLQRLHGPAIPDPDMTIEVYLLAETVGVLTYSDCFGSRKVFCPELMAFSPSAKVELNHFLEQWLSKMIADGRRQPVTEIAQ